MRGGGGLTFLHLSLRLHTLQEATSMGGVRSGHFRSGQSLQTRLKKGGGEGWGGLRKRERAKLANLPFPPPPRRIAHRSKLGQVFVSLPPPRPKKVGTEEEEEEEEEEGEKNQFLSFLTLKKREPLPRASNSDLWATHRRWREGEGEKGERQGSRWKNMIV